MACNNTCACWRTPTFDHAIYALELECLEAYPTDAIKRLNAITYPSMPPLRGTRKQIMETYALRLTLYPRLK